MCQSCGKKEANTHIKRITNGELTEYRLCECCAQKLGYTSIFGGLNLDIDSFLGIFFADNKPHYRILSDSTKCEQCGSSFEDISRCGKVGCAACYSVFYDKLEPSIRRIHGNVKHAGKFANSLGQDRRILNEIEKLKDDLKVAIDAQEFERAAELRDKIKDIEGRTSGNE